MRLTIAVLVFTSLVGCASKRFDYVAVGTVRNVHVLGNGAIGDYSHVMFEHDTGQMQMLGFYGAFPGWANQHLRLEYTCWDDGSLCRVREIRRLDR
jgi:hypothetical protein